MRGSRIRSVPGAMAATIALGLNVAAIASGCGTQHNATTAPSASTQASTTQASTTATPASTTPTPQGKAKGKSKTPPASPAPANSDQAAILQQLPSLPYPPGSYQLQVRISKASPNWAAVYIRPRPGFTSQVQPDSASFTKQAGSWRVHQAGNGGGCGVPAPVRAELKLHCY